MRSGEWEENRLFLRHATRLSRLSRHVTECDATRLHHVVPDAVSRLVRSLSTLELRCTKIDHVGMPSFALRLGTA